MRAFFHFPLGRAEKVEGGQKKKIGQKRGPGRGLGGRHGRAGGGAGEEKQGQCRNGKAGAVLPGAVEGKKIKASTFLCKPFSILHICGEPFNGDAENAGKYDKFIIGYKAQAGFNAADGRAPDGQTGKLQLGDQRVLRHPLRGAGLVDSIAGDIGLALVCINLQTFSPRFT